MTPTEFAHWLCDQLQDDFEAFDITRGDPASVALVLRDGEGFTLEVFTRSSNLPKRKQFQRKEP